MPDIHVPSNVVLGKSCFASFVSLDINECSSPDVCGHNGNCSNTFGSFVCDCEVGYRPNSIDQSCEGETALQYKAIGIHLS